jgi:hypothetical protein
MIAFAVWLQVAAAAAPALEMTVHPPVPLLARGSTALEMQCDLIVRNGSTTPWRLDDLEANAYDAAGRPISLRRLGANGTAPSIETVPDRTVAPGARMLVFNPFWSFDAVAPPAKVHFKLTFSEDVKDSTREHVVEATVTPKVHEQKAALVVPLKGRVLVWDGHDFLSHHRRLNFVHPALVQMGVKNNPLRYAYDMSIVDEDGKMYRGDGKKREDWYGWEVPVQAPGDGTVVEAKNDVQDHQVGEYKVDIEEILRNPKSLSGNYVIIDHGNGEHSLIAHLRAGTVTVKPGDRVKQGQPIAKMGFSGDAFTVHIHYELRSGTPFDVEGLPSAFRGYERLLGAQRVPVKEGVIDTGDIVFVP